MLVKTIFSMDTPSSWDQKALKHYLFKELVALVGTCFCNLRWLKTGSSTNISIGYCNHYLSLDATTMVSKYCPIIGEHVVVFSIT